MTALIVFFVAFDGVSEWTAVSTGCSTPRSAAR
jgi:hypothetical protein